MNAREKMEKTMLLNFFIKCRHCLFVNINEIELAFSVLNSFKAVI